MTPLVSWITMICCVTGIVLAGYAMKEMCDGDYSPEKEDGRLRGELDATLGRDFDDTPDRVYTRKQKKNYREWYKIGYENQKSLEEF